MNNLSVQTQLRINNAVAFLFVIAASATGVSGMTMMDAATDQLLNAEEMVAVASDIELMHDAIRADVYSGVSHHLLDDSTQLQTDTANLAQHITVVQEKLGKLESMNATPRQAELSQTLKPKLLNYAQTASQVLESARTGVFNPDEMKGLLSQFDEVQREMATLSGEIENHAIAKRADAGFYFRFSLLVNCILACAALAVLILMRKRTVKAVNDPLSSLVSAMSRMEAESDLTIRADVRTGNELGHAARVFNKLVETMHGIVRDVQSASHDLQRTSEELAATSTDGVSNSQTTSSTASNVAAAVEELSNSISQITMQAEEANNVSISSMLLSKQSHAAISKAHEEMSFLSTSVQQSAQEIENLEAKATSIYEISGVIKSIAQQTDLLALNAAIEAALAGEQGKGFAVVASEVRNLAEKTSESTSRISHTVNSIQSSTTSASAQMRDGVARVRVSEELSSTVKESILQVEHNARTAADAVSQIAESLHEQRATGRDIASSVETVASSSERALFLAQKTADQAFSLASLAKVLDSRVKQFRV